MIREKYTKQIWILLAESFLLVVSKVSQPLWFVGKLIFLCVYLISNPAVAFVCSYGHGVFSQSNNCFLVIGFPFLAFSQTTLSNFFRLRRLVIFQVVHLYQCSLDMPYCGPRGCRSSNFKYRDWCVQQRSRQRQKSIVRIKHLVRQPRTGRGTMASAEASPPTPAAVSHLTYTTHVSTSVQFREAHGTTF